MALGLVLLSWAVLGFAGLSGYPHCYDTCPTTRSRSSYSVVALASARICPVGGGRLAVVARGGAARCRCLVARDRRGRDREVGNADARPGRGLAASPIVWVHYFLLLLVPLALARPRLSLLWVVPFAY